MKLRFLSALGTADTILLLRNLGVMLKAGVPLVRALSIYEGDTPKRTRRVVSHLRQSVEAGHSLAEAMETAPRLFPPLAVNLVRTGELSGTLQESLATIVRHLQKAQDLKRKIRGAMMYPCFVLVAIGGLGLSVGTLVLPDLIPLFESLDVELPWTTKTLLWVAGVFDEHGTLITLSVLSGIMGIFLISRLEATKPLLHRFFLMIPYVGAVQTQATLAQVTATLGTLLKSGIPLQEGLRATAGATGNRVFRRALLQALPGIEAGHTLSETLRRSGKLFPGMTVTMISIGEESGTLASTMDYLADSYEGEVDFAVKNLTTALEPLLLIGIGLIVGFTVLSIITPIYDVTGSVQ